MFPESRVPKNSRQELERRARLVRERLREVDAQALVVFSHDNNLGGYVRWLTDSSVAYATVVILHRDDLATVIEHGNHGSHRVLDGEQPGYFGVGESYGVAAFQSVHYTHRYEAEVTGTVLRQRGYRRVAVVNGDAMPAAFKAALDAEGFELVDETDYLDAVKAIKSPEEQERLIAGAALQDEAMAAVISQIRPGMTEREVSALGEYEAQRRGGHFGLVMCGSGGRGASALLHKSENQGRRVREGDAISLLIENGSPDGYFLEVARPVVLGEPWPELTTAFENSRALQAFVIDLLRAGTACAAVHERYRERMRALGLPEDRRVYAHGQGYDLIERPLIRWDEPMTLAPGMCLAVHPTAFGGGEFAFVCDNVLVTKGAPKVLHRLDHRIFVAGEQVG